MEELDANQDGERRAGGSDVGEEDEGASSGEEEDEVRFPSCTYRVMWLTTSVWQMDENEAVEDLPSDSESRGKDPNAITQEEEDEFTRELAKMISSTGDPRKPTERKAVPLDFAVPLAKRPQRTERAEVEEDLLEERPKVMSFTLLTKKGSKQQTLKMEIPVDSAIAIHTLEKRAQDKAEQQELKRRVLDYESREEQSEKQCQSFLQTTTG